MKKYIVNSPCLVFAINDGITKGKREYILKQGDEIELPEDNIAVRAMFARKQISEIATPKKK